MNIELDKGKVKEGHSSFRDCENMNSNLDVCDWKNRIRHKNSCTVFHKRTQSGYSKATPSKISNL